MKSKKALKDEKGVVLVVALVMLLVLTLIGINALSTSTFETNIAGNERLYNTAFYAADGGFENFKGLLASGQTFTGILPQKLPDVAIGDNSFGVTIMDRWTRSEGGILYQVYKIECEGTAPGFPIKGKVKVESVIEQSILSEGY
jgi:hypothetical protein